MARDNYGRYMALDVRYEQVAWPDLSGAPLVVFMEGWVDAGLAASAAMVSLLEATAAEAVIVFDGDDLIDQRARRPIAELVDGETRAVTWPTIQLRAGLDGAGRPVAFLMGPEPDFHWVPFAGAICNLMPALGLSAAYGLGAFPAPAPHTRPVRVAATSPDAERARNIGVVPGKLEVPAGIGTVLELAMAERGIPALGLWARIPHYVAAMPYPPGSAALIDALAEASGLVLDSSNLKASADAALQRIDGMIAASEEHSQMVRHLEAHLDAAEGNPLEVGEIPSGDELAAELERFLRGEQP